MIRTIFVLQVFFVASVSSCCWTHGGCYSKWVYRDCCWADDDSGPNIIAVDGSRLYAINRNTSIVTTLVVGLRSANQIDYHQSKSFIYFASSYYGSMHRICYPCHTNERETEVIIPEVSDYHPFSIAIDSDHDHIYWSDHNLKAVIRSELDGSNKTVILDSENVVGIGHIALDVNNSWIYIVNFVNRSIDRCTFNGNETDTVLVDRNITRSSRIALDLVEKRVYWTTLNITKSATLEGNDTKEIFRIPSWYHYYWYSILSIDVYGDYVYHTDNWRNSYVSKVNKSGELQYNSVARVRSLIGDIKIYHGTVMIDPCRNYTRMDHLEKRSTDFLVNWKSDGPISDDILQDGWYRIFNDNGLYMSTSAPGPMHCGTNYPIWLNGTLPEFVEGTVIIEACMQTNESRCEESIDIKIRNCDGYFVHYLRATPTNSSYCFGSGKVKCPTGMSSESEYYPGCSFDYPNETMAVEVNALLEEGQTFTIPGYDPTPSLIPIFKCVFEDISNGTYVYDVYWYICGTIIKNSTNILFDDIYDAIVLKESDWSDRYHMNMEVKCSIRMRYSALSTPGSYMYSPVFHAGLYSHGTYFNILEGESINISFTATVPVGCISSHRSIRRHCDQNFYIYAPHYGNKGMTCTNNMVNRNVVFKAQFCGIRLGNLDWNETKALQVYGFSDGLYNSYNRYTYIRLSAPSVSTFNNIWKNVNIPQIRVKVVDKDAFLRNRICQSYNDPHIRTYDGKLYHYMAVGEFVMYRNDEGPYWVHALFTSCGYGWPGSSCNCGIAIRSHDSLFVLRTCQRISRRERHLLQQPVVKLTMCDEKDMVIENTQSTYKVTLPIGTEIRFKISRRLISMISIKPSLFDIQTAKGLCGVPSKLKDPSDDYTHREKGPISNDQIFAESWRITPEMTEEQLFVDEPKFNASKNNYQVVFINETDSNSNLGRFCTCEDQASSTDSLEDFYTVHCNLTESTEQCSSSGGSGDRSVQYTSCSQADERKKRSLNFLNTLNKRSLDGNDDFIDSQSLSYDEDVNNTEAEPAKTFRNGWTTERAYNICYHSIKSALPTDMYKGYVDVPEDSFIESCVKDIEVTADTTFLGDTINAMVTFITTELVKTESLYLSNRGSQTILEYFSSLLCPGHCSNNGNCESRVCSCNYGFIGDDCSYNITQPPADISLPFDGLCKLRTRSCRTTNIFGEYLSTNICQVSQESLSYTHDEKIFLAEYRNLFMITVVLPLSRKKRSTNATVMSDGYDISLSYDGVHFGDSISIIIYDDQQYSCNSTTKYCISMLDQNDSSEDKDIILTVVPAILGVFVGAFVIGIICYKYLNKTKITASDDTNSKLPDPRMYSDKKWIDREHTISDLELHFDVHFNSEEVFEKQFPPIGHQKKDL